MEAERRVKAVSMVQVRTRMLAMELGDVVQCGLYCKGDSFGTSEWMTHGSAEQRHSPRYERPGEDTGGVFAGERLGIQKAGLTDLFILKEQMELKTSSCYFVTFSGKIYKKCSRFVNGSKQDSMYSSLAIPLILPVYRPCQCSPSTS